MSVAHINVMNNSVWGLCYMLTCLCVYVLNTSVFIFVVLRRYMGRGCICMRVLYRGG